MVEGAADSGVSSPEDLESVSSRFARLSVDLIARDVEEEGLYGVKCQPHFGMGMVALIQVGAPVNREAVEAVKLKGKAAARFEPLLARVD